MMLSNKQHGHNALIMSNLSHKAKLFMVLLKFRLSFLVVFSGGFGYALASQTAINWTHFWVFCLGSFLITGAANTINQIIEKDTDKLMKRTQNRPLPLGTLSVSEAVIFTTILGLLGTLCVAYVSVFAAALGLFSLLLYGFLYTPLKSKSTTAVFVGAFPGALPPLIGWVAVTGQIDFTIFVIFMIQFVWQFPHFWAIAWIADEDYKKAGIRLLPSKEKNLSSTIQIVSYTLLLIPLGLLPWWMLSLTGVTSAVLITVCGLLFSCFAVYLLVKTTNKAAKWLMFASFFYLPIVQIALLMDTI